MNFWLKKLTAHLNSVMGLNLATNKKEFHLNRPLCLLMSFFGMLTLPVQDAFARRDALSVSQNFQSQQSGSERRFKRGAGGSKGNENSVKPPSLPRVAEPVERDRQREADENRTQRGKNGCPDGTFSVVFAPDGMSFSILFDNFVAETRGLQALDIMRCHLIIPVEVPANTRMTITRIDYRGFVNVQAGGFAVLRAAFSFQGKRQGSGPGDSRAYSVNFRHDFQGPIAPEQQNYILSSDAFSDRQAISACGGVNNLRISNTLRIQGAGRDAIITLDSADGAGELRYFVSYQNCTN
jgi:hypothetical protein